MTETRKVLPDRALADILIAPAPRESHYSVLVDAVEELRPIKTFLESVRWSHIDTCAHSVLFYVGFGNDLAGFDFGDDLDPGEQPFEGVRFSELLSIPPREIIVSQTAFERLILRYFDVMSAVVPKRSPEVANDPRWRDFLNHVEVLRSRIKTEAP
jgi:hypothetical protein